MSTTLDSIKADLPSLLDVLTVQRPGNHCPCRFCGSHDALSIFQGEDGWAFLCHSCWAAGDLFNAVALIENCSSAEAFRRLGIHDSVKYGNRLQRIQPTKLEPVTPVPDRERVYRLSEMALTNVFEGRADKWIAKRGITKDFVQRRPILGFVVTAKIIGWKNPLRNAWIIRVCTPDGQCVALKGHRENPPEEMSKGFWLPVGTEPAAKPRHGYATLWPPPEWLPASDWLYLCPGELKAAAVLSAGRNATSVTTGESFRWTPAQVARLMGRRVCIVFDDDKAGHHFRDNALNALNDTATELKAVTFGSEAE